jgi:Cof subfamily protein (haloacid dehalogenase superfamily)
VTRRATRALRWLLVLDFPPTLDALPAGLLPGGRFGDWSPRRPRYVVVDVDGTLVGVDGRATAVVEDAVATCRSAGLPVGLATGRMPRGCDAIAEQVGVSGPHVVHNGAEVRNAGGPVRRWPLARAQVDALLAVAARHDLYVELYVDDDYWVTDRRDAARPHWELLGVTPRGLVTEIDRGRVLKATVLVFPGADEAGIAAALKAADLAPGPAHAPAFPGVLFLNVTASGADKGTALGAAARHLGCRLAEVVAVGDGLNDLSMLAVAGTAVAMGQAAPEVRAAAHLVVPDQDADGVAHALHAALSWRVTSSTATP